MKKTIKTLFRFLIFYPIGFPIALMLWCIGTPLLYLSHYTDWTWPLIVAYPIAALLALWGDFDDYLKENGNNNLHM